MPSVSSVGVPAGGWDLGGGGVGGSTFSPCVSGFPVDGGGPDGGFEESPGRGKGCGVWAEPLTPRSVASSHPVRNPRFILGIIAASIIRIAPRVRWIAVRWNLDGPPGVFINKGVACGDPAEPAAPPTGRGKMTSCPTD